MRETTCKIQWIDSVGRPTPDDREAVAVAVSTTVYRSSGETVVRRYPICAEHLDRMERADMWRETPRDDAPTHGSWHVESLPAEDTGSANHDV